MRPRALLTVLCLAATAALSTAPAEAQRDPLAIRAKGSPTAPVTVYEMSDFQCPFCKQHTDDIFPTLEREFIRTGKVRWIFINYPLTSIHPNAIPAAEFAMCAAREDRFWPAHDLLFRHQKLWAPLRNPGPFLATLIDSLALSRPRMEQCLQTGATRAEIRADAEGAVRSGARSTPSFYIEGGLMTGVRPVALFRHILDSVYAVKSRK